MENKVQEMKKGSLSVQMGNIFPLIKKWLYSEKDIFARELVTNALDAITKHKHLTAKGEDKPTEQEYAINVKIDRENKKIIFSDNGIGMTEEEIRKYINEVAFSGADEFLSKYKDSGEGGQIVGHFGLGFYSSFMVASKVEIDTLSWESDAVPVYWSCEGEPDFLIGTGTRKERGTDVILSIMKDEEEFLDEYRLQHVLKTYCSFMPVPVYLNGILINDHKPLWLSKPSDITEQEYLDFYGYLYPYEEKPIFWIHINIEFPIRAQGILYFPKLTHELDSNKGKIRFYYNQVYVSDNLKGLLPDFLMHLRGVIDCPDMPLNVSRSYLQNDSTMTKLSSHITRKVSDELSGLFKAERSRYETYWEDINPFIKIGMMEHDKFYEAMKNSVVFMTSSGKYVTLEEFLKEGHGVDVDENEKKSKKIYYSTDKTNQSFYIDIFRQQNKDILILDSWLDGHFVRFLEMKNPNFIFARVDSELLESALDKQGESGILDPKTNKTFSEMIRDFFKETLTIPGLKEVKTEFLRSSFMPAAVIVDENARRMQEFTEMFTKKASEGLSEHTLVINGHSPVIKNLRKMMDGIVPPIEEMKLIAWQVYDLALLTQRLLPSSRLETYVSNSRLTLENYTKKLTE